eukprot:1142707-Pelagomonas_calceolata.AAC.8
MPDNKLSWPVIHIHMQPASNPLKTSITCDHRVVPYLGPNDVNSTLDLRNGEGVAQGVAARALDVGHPGLACIMSAVIISQCPPLIPATQKHHPGCACMMSAISRNNIKQGCGQAVCSVGMTAGCPPKMFTAGRVLTWDDGSAHLG